MSDNTSVMLKLIEDIVKSLVDKPEKVILEVNQGDRTIVVNVNVDKEDVGKIIGKQGQVIISMRKIVENIAAKNGKRISLLVID